jgi:hypothetical protein
MHRSHRLSAVHRPLYPFPYRFIFTDKVSLFPGSAPSPSVARSDTASRRSVSIRTPMDYTYQSLFAEFVRSAENKMNEILSMNVVAFRLF